MAAKKASISILMTADAAKAKAAFADVEKRAGSLQNQMGNVAKSIGGAFATGAIIKFAGGALKAAEAASTSEARIRQVSTSMGVFGDQVDAVTSRLTKYADETARATGIDANQIKLTQAKLLTFKNLAVTADDVGGAFDRATKAAIDMAAAGFGEASMNAVQLGKALQDPIKGITALNRSGITFTEDQKKVIASLVETNRVGEAQAIILKAIEEQVGGTAEATANDTDKMRVAFTQLQEKVGEALVPAFKGLLDAVLPIIDVFTSMPKELRQVITTLGLVGGLTRSLKTTLTGFGLAAKTASLATGALGGALLVYSLHAQNAAKNAAKFEQAMADLSRASDEQIKVQLAAAMSAAIFAGEFGNAEKFLTKIAQTSLGTTERLRDLGIAQEMLGLTTEQVNAIIDEQTKGFQQAEADANRHADAIAGLEAGETEAAAAAEELNQALEEQERQLQAVVTATLSAFNAQLGYESQTWATDDAIAAYNDTLGSMIDGTYDGSNAARDLAKAENEVYENALRQAAAAAQLAADTAKASGQQLTAAETARIQADELQKVANSLDPGSPLRAQLVAYIRELGAIPREITTRLTTIQEAYRAIGAPAVGLDLTGPINARAMGGFVAQNTPYLVGENGPELFIPAGSGRISNQTGGSITINVAGSVISENDLIETVRKGLANSQRSGNQLVY